MKEDFGISCLKFTSLFRVKKKRRAIKPIAQKYNKSEIDPLANGRNPKSNQKPYRFFQ